MCRSLLLAPLLAVTLLAAPGVAKAHLINSGLGPFYDGVLHLLLSPADLLGVVVLALLLSAAVVPLHTEWGRIAVRVVGSWVAAVGLLMFGWLLQGAS
jgi:hypothetical protein